MRECICENCELPTSDSGNLETRSNLCRQSSLSSAQDNVQKLLRCRHRRDILPRRLHLGGPVGVVCCKERATARRLYRAIMFLGRGANLESFLRSFSSHRLWQKISPLMPDGQNSWSQVLALKTLWPPPNFGFVHADFVHKYEMNIHCRDGCCLPVLFDSLYIIHYCVLPAKFDKLLVHSFPKLFSGS